MGGWVSRNPNIVRILKSLITVDNGTFWSKWRNWDGIMDVCIVDYFLCNLGFSVLTFSDHCIKDYDA